MEGRKLKEGDPLARLMLRLGDRSLLTHYEGFSLETLRFNQWGSVTYQFLAAILTQARRIHGYDSLAKRTPPCDAPPSTYKTRAPSMMTCAV